MHGYSKIKVVGNENSRSVESSSSDLMPLPQKPKPNPITDADAIPTPTEKKQEINQIIKNSSTKLNTQDSLSEQEDDQEGNDNNGEMFSPKFRRNSSVSSAYALQAAMKRAFSMRRSSSVSERYCRIHDQSVTLSSPFDDEELYTNGTRRSGKKKNSRGKILKAWKKLFGL